MADYCGLVSVAHMIYYEVRYYKIIHEVPIHVPYF